jgi:hypothetical protein
LPGTLEFNFVLKGYLKKIESGIKTKYAINKITGEIESDAVLSHDPVDMKTKPIIKIKKLKSNAI